VTITTTPRRSKSEYLWSGLIHFEVDSDCSLDYLKGAKGGYVNVVCLATSASDFTKRVFQFLCQRQLSMVDATQISTVDLDREENLSLEWVELSKRAIASGEVESTEFHLYETSDSADGDSEDG